MSPSKKQKHRNRSRKADLEDNDLPEEPIEQQSQEEKREVRNRLRDMNATLQELKSEPLKNDEKLKAVMAEAKNIISEVRGTSEAIEDAKMFNNLCIIVREYSEDTSSNERSFVVSDYCNNLARMFNAPSSGDGFRFSKGNLVNMGTKMSTRFKRAPTLKFVLGTLNTEEKAPDEKKENQRRRTVNKGLTKAVPTKTAIVEKSQATEAKTDKFVKLTKKCLEDLFIKKGRKPVCYFTFVIDPDSFGKTVENMFHVSFLVKQRAAVLAIGENGLPTLEPLLGRGGEEEEEELVSDQAVININLEFWKELKNNLKITKKCIITS